MRAIVIDDTSPTRALRCAMVPEPAAGAQDLLVAVRAAGVNRADLRRAVTHFAASSQMAQPIPGLELAGEVLAVGAEVAGFAVGDRVMAMASSAFAERAAVDHRLAVRVPECMTWEAAAATPVAFITAHDALVTAGGFRPGESVLVQGASTGAGIATVQIARLLDAAVIAGTAGTVEKLGRLRALGCDVTANYREEDVAAALRHSRPDGFEVTVDYAGGAMVRTAIDAAAIRGRIVCAGRVAGAEATIDIDEFSRKRIRMTGVTNRTRTLDERIATVRAFRADILPALEAGAILPVIDSVYALDDAEAAQAHMRGNTHFGKIVLRV